MKGLDEIPVVRWARERGRKALARPPRYGPDVDVSWVTGPGSLRLGVEEGRVREAVDLLGFGGVEPGFVQVDDSFMVGVVARILERYGATVMPTGEALLKLDLARELAWRLVDPGEDKFTGLVAAYWGGHGFFIYVPPGVRVREPVYACLFIARQGYPQLLHNIVYVGDGGELHLVTGCATAKTVTRALHVSVTEIYLGRGSKLTYTMIHSWGPQVHVRPRTGARLGEGASYTSYYLVFSTVASIQQYPTVHLARNAKYTSITVAVGRGGSIYDLGSRAILEGEDASAKMVSRLAAFDESQMISRARIEAHARGRGHIECSGLQLSPKASIETIPELYSAVEGAELSHEAAIGRVAEEELEYLMARGMSEEEAVTMVLQGFLAVEEPELPPKIRSMVEATTRLLAERRGL